MLHGRGETIFLFSFYKTAITKWLNNISRDYLNIIQEEEEEGKA